MNWLIVVMGLFHLAQLIILAIYLYERKQEDPMTHEHSWIKFLEFAKGYWEKRDCPGDGYMLPGRIDICSCDARRFVCSDTNFPPVEIEAAGQ